ncbi:hypothetical protein BDZ89DRAFT_940339 [Hymenopellis radicata]|nr:hypothetical protein BDZ89DRAFT_940339 [Hymenopellis radicata]
MALEPPSHTSTSKRPSPPSNSRSTPQPAPPSVNHLKPSLLSPSQKKANHIQSEQKRRANIRRGYEALCEAVPSLREALAAQGQPEPRKRRRTSNGGSAEEKLDGRAGPRSENVVLGKTIEYIHGLLAETEELKARLATMEPPRRDGDEPRLWERTWDGGKKRDDDDGEDSDE